MAGSPPVDPAGPAGFVKGTIADPDALDARFNAAFAALDATKQGINDSMVSPTADINGTKIKARSIDLDRMTFGLVAKLGLEAGRASADQVGTMSVGAGHQQAVGLTVTQPNPGITLVFWQAEIRFISGVGPVQAYLAAGGALTVPVVDPATSNNSTFQWFGGIGGPTMRAAFYNLPGASTWQVAHVVNSGAGEIRSAKLRAITIGF